MFSKLDGKDFWMVTVAGILATYVMSVTAVWQAGLGLQPLAAGTGIFFSNTPQPLAMAISSFVPHIAYGVALTFALAAASTSRERDARPE